MESLGRFIVLCIVTVALMLGDGFLLSTMWGWLVVPVFGGPYMSILAAIIISFMLTYLVRCKTYTKPTQEEQDNFWGRIGWTVYMKLYLFLVAYIISQFV